MLRDADVAELATIDVALDAMSDIFRLEGEGLTGESRRFNIPNECGWLRIMSVAAPGLGSFGFKAMNLTAGVGVRYAVWVYDIEGGALRGIVDAKTVTAMRTAATSAVATRELARDDVERIAIIGTGAEARTHLEAMHKVRPASKITVFSRSAANRAAFIAEMSPLVDADLVDCGSLDEAVSNADVVVLATKSAEPVLFARHLEPGMHVNSIGSARDDQYELALDTFPEFATVVCDSKAHVFTEAGDAIAAAASEFDVDGAVNLSELVVGTGRGRTTDEETTLFKSVGTATQDMALAARLLDLAAAGGHGTQLGDFPTLKAFGQG
jgi:ornithine cyclodeaminase/alanine dehydrogenase